MLPFSPQPKPRHGRFKMSQRQKGEITAKVRKEVNARTLLAPIGCCERCGRNRNGFWTLELAHIDSRLDIDHKTTRYDLLRLCSPSTNSNTCHFFSHSPEGKEWMKEIQERLMHHETLG